MKIHDHFEGRAHCVECKGPCHLAGDELEISRIVRYVMEHFAYAGWEELPAMMQDAFWGLLGSVAYHDMYARAKRFSARAGGSR